MDFDYTTETITPDNSGTITIAGQLAVTGGVAPSTATAVAAAGTTQGTATALTSAINVITSATSGTSQCVVLPSTNVNIGYSCTIMNDTSVAITVFPPGAGTIDGTSSITLPANQNIVVLAAAVNGTTWLTQLPVLFAGTNITLTSGPGGITLASTGGGGGTTFDQGLAYAAIRTFYLP